MHQRFYCNAERLKVCSLSTKAGGLVLLWDSSCAPNSFVRATCDVTSSAWHQLEAWGVGSWVTLLNVGVRNGEIKVTSKSQVVRPTPFPLVVAPAVARPADAVRPVVEPWHVRRRRLQLMRKHTDWICKACLFKLYHPTDLLQVYRSKGTQTIINPTRVIPGPPK
jgi:hypothetical protein